MDVLLLALGLVLLLEGLVLALAPSRIEQILAMLAAMPEDTRRLIGMLAVTLGGMVMTLGVLLATG